MEPTMALDMVPMANSFIKQWINKEPKKWNYHDKSDDHTQESPGNFTNNMDFSTNFVYTRRKPVHDEWILLDGKVASSGLVFAASLIIFRLQQLRVDYHI
jgi:hypothetical protein